MRRALPASLVLLLAAAACSRAPEAPSAGQTRAPRTGGAAPATVAPSPLASSQSQAPPPADPKAAAEIRKEIAGFSLTEPILEKVLATEGDLRDFWADPAEAAKIRSERSLPKILAAIDASPRIKTTIEKHGLTPREYILGTFSMIGGFIWEKARTQQPASVAGRQPPVNATTLATVQKHLPEVTKLLSPPPGRTKPAKKPAGHPDDE